MPTVKCWIQHDEHSAKKFSRSAGSPDGNAGLSQPALAGICQRLGWDVGRDAIAKIESRIRWVADSELVFLARALDCTLLDLYPASVQAAFRRKL
ncbi:MAG: helix-turn-helix domain-containing protein [Terrimicrobiaceae bacterium]